jgi:hypothetical protein
MTSFTRDKISVTVINNNYLIGHHTPADLSVLKDFETFKSKLQIIRGSFVTLGKPLIFGDKNVYIRDTILLAPSSKKSLADLGSIYNREELKKIEIDKE